MKKFFSLLCLCATATLCLVADQAKTGEKTSDMVAIDQKMKQLRDQKAQCQMSAYEASDNADNCMDHSDWMGYEQAVQQEEAMQKKIAEIDAELRALRAQKEKALRQ